MTMINPLAAALAAVFEQAVQAALQASNDRLEAHIARLDAHVHQLDALADRVATLEKNEDALVRRIAVLENQPAGTPTTITADAFVTHLDNQEWFWHKIAGFVANHSAITGNDLELVKSRLDELEETDGRGLTKDQVREIAESAAEEALDSHTSDYDHDEYDSHLQDDDRHPDSDIEDAVRSALNGTSVTLSF